MQSLSDEKRYFKLSRNQNFRCPIKVGSLLRIFKKSFLWFLHFRDVTVASSVKIKNNWSHKFSFYYYQRFSRIFVRKREIVKNAVYHKCGVQLDNLIRPIVINTLNSHQFQRIRSTCVIKDGCPYWTYLTLLLSSETGPPMGNPCAVERMINL